MMGQSPQCSHDESAQAAVAGGVPESVEQVSQGGHDQPGSYQ